MNEIKKNDLVLAVLLNYNQNDYTIKCVESLLESDYPNLKVLLIDNGSVKENVEALEKNLPNNENLILKKIKDNIGYPQGSNFGLEEGLKLNPKYYLILNNDTIIDKYAVSELVKTSKKYNDRARVTGKVYHYDKPNILQFISFNFKNKKNLSYVRIGVDEQDNGQYDDLEELEMMDDIFVLHPVDLYKLNGGYSIYLWLNGVNIDISLRAIAVGYKLIFSPKAKIWHKGSVSIGGREMNPKLAFWNIQGKLILGYMHMPKLDFIVYYIKIFFNNVLRTKAKYILGNNSMNDQYKNYADAKIKAYSYFNKWVFKQNKNTGYSPY